MGVLATLVLCGIAAVGFNKRPREKQSVSPANEKTPLLADIRPKSESERTVTFVEPVVATSSSAANGGAIVDDGAAPKKKSTRRRVRGKKKKKDDSASTAGEGDDDGDEEEKAEGSGSGSGSPLNAKGEKPLPDLPREMSSTNLQDQEDKERLAISDTIVGYGSHGTVVLKGTWGGRPVAVKRLLSDFTRLASQEVKLLQASDDHPNVIRCE
jgi:serine/threonine-protein kinase/endoribonuclease IRE1